MEKHNESGESKFGFKDKAKALETIKLLSEQDLEYQKLTVRGLLGRAKRVLQMTKAEEKIKNIESAIEVFEDWIEKNAGSSSSKTPKKSDDDKIETVPGLGFKNKEAAEKTLKILKGRDPNYQKLAVKGLIGNSKRVLQATKNEDKIKSIQEGVKILENFLDEFDRENCGAQNMAYLSIDIVKSFDSPENKLVAEFIQAYGDKAKGRYEHLRTLYPRDDDSKSWDIVRNKHLNKIRAKISENKTKLFNDDGSPTAAHIELIQWAFSPNVDKLKQFVQKNNGKSGSSKRKSSNNQNDTDDDNVSEKKKRSH